MASAKAIWDDAMVYLKDELTDISYNNWIKDVAPVALVGESMILEAPNIICLNMLKERYVPVVTNAVARVCNHEYSITFIAPDERAKYMEDPALTRRSAAGAPQLNGRYTFDTFVIGENNRFARAAAYAVAQQPAQAYNPLFIYGGVGLGKTHLLHAIGNYIFNESPSSKIQYVSSEEFTNELITAIQRNRTMEFRDKYRNVDVLMIDDIQFVAGKKQTEEEVFHTFNTLYNSNKQIIISSDKPPKEINNLEARLCSRFDWGLLADIQSPDLETRSAILNNKAAQENIVLDSDVTLFIAEKVTSNIRELEGSLNKVIAYSRLTGKEINITLAHEALRDFFPNAEKKKITIELIKDIVADFYTLDVKDLSSPRHEKRVAYPRQVAMYIAQEYTNITLKKIGESFGGKHHSTVIHACDRIREEIKNDPVQKNDIEDIIKRVTE
jgi:chromosomal replication initiator protein